MNKQFLQKNRIFELFLPKQNETLDKTDKK